MRVVAFGDHARWIAGDQERGVEHIDWVPLKTKGGTNTAEAIDLISGTMSRKYLGERNYRPIVVLCTDGGSSQPDRTAEASAKLKNSLKSRTGIERYKVIRIAVGVHGGEENGIVISPVYDPDAVGEERED